MNDIFSVGTLVYVPAVANEPLGACVFHPLRIYALRDALRSVQSPS